MRDLIIAVLLMAILATVVTKAAATVGATLANNISTIQQIHTEE